VVSVEWAELAAREASVVLVELAELAEPAEWVEPAE